MADEARTAADRDGDARVAELERALAERDAEIAALRAQVAQLGKLVTELSEKLNQNSKNSHLAVERRPRGWVAGRAHPEEE